MALAASSGNNRETLRNLGNEVFIVIILFTHVSIHISHMRHCYLLTSRCSLQLNPSYLHFLNNHYHSRIIRDQNFRMSWRLLSETTNGCVAVANLQREITGLYVFKNIICVI